jgi:AhpC/TSA family
MTLTFLHPREDVLAEYASGTLDARTRDRTSAHLRECAKCQATLRFLVKLDQALATPASAAPHAILTRALEARASGERHVLPKPDEVHGTQRPQHRRLGWTVALAASIALIVAAVVSRPDNVTASAAQSEMRISPAKARPGDSIRIVYRPSAGLFAANDKLVLRARLRMSGDGMYSSGVPASRVQAVATLHRSPNGDFSGSFVLPDSIAFVSMVVEDTAATHVDDNGDRLWEVLSYGADDKPTFDALDQRAADLMGRSWEEAYETSKRMTTMYPDRYESWNLRVFFERALFGDAGGDSLAKAYDARMKSLIASAKTRPALSESEIGSIFYARLSRAYYRPTATAADTAELAYWLARLEREHPRHMQLAQHYTFRFTPEQWKHPDAGMLDSLERLYARFAPLKGPGRNLEATAVRLAASSKDDAVYRRWSERTAGVDSREDSAYALALALLRRPSLRHEGQAMLRKVLASGPEALAGARGLREDHKAYLRSADDARRVALAALGRSLIADGRTRDGLDTLGLAAKGSWDPELFRSLRAAYTAAGDSAGVLAMRARLVVDPRTPTDSLPVITTAARAQLSAAAWDSLVSAARNEMHARLLDGAINRSLRGAPSVLGDDGKTHKLRDLSGGQPTAVIFWSRHCGAAIGALPSIIEVAERMTRQGKRLIFVVDEPPSADIAQYLRSKHWALPVYHDVHGEMMSAFSNFGTPAFYVIDGASHIRFDGLGEEPELIAQIDALRAERGVN